MASRGFARPGNLPPELTNFVGRHDQVQTAQARLAESRLVTLTGIGGVGKTRLALRVAAAVRLWFPDGVWLVSLDQLHDGALLPQALAGAMGLRELRGPSPRAALADHLADLRVLLVLDNCEHLIDAVAKLADALLRNSPELRILATSREALALPGEVLLPVPPLEVPDLEAGSLPEVASAEAVALFMDRARTVVPAFELTERNAGAVVDICWRLDGLPLAIELAAARLRVLSPEQLNDRLRDRFALLTRGPRDAPDRQQTLRACIEWSFHLCTQSEQRLWRRLSVFAGGFELDAVAGICNGRDLAVDDLFELAAALVMKSVVVTERHGDVVRYRMLESIRGYGLERLHEAGEAERFRLRHRNWYERLVLRAESDWIGPQQVEWLDRLDRERPDIRAALQFSLSRPGGAESVQRVCAALHAYWLMRGLTTEARAWLDRALATPAAPPTRDRLKATYTATILAAVQGDITGATALALQADELADRLGGEWAKALARLAAGAPAAHSGNPHDSVAKLEPALAVFDREGDVYWTVMALAGLAMVAGFTGDTARATACYEHLLAITEAHGEVRLRSIALWSLGIVLWKEGEPEEAARRFKDSLRLRIRLKDTFGTALCLDALAWIAAHAGQMRRAAVLLGVVAALERATGSPTGTYPDLYTYHQECERRIRDQLGDPAFRAATERGAQLRLEDATAYALDDVDEPAPATPVPAPAPKQVIAAATVHGVLSRREREVCELVAEGLSNKEIAARLVLSQRTVEGHVQRALNKLGFSNRALIAAWVVQQREERAT